MLFRHQPPLLTPFSPLTEPSVQLPTVGLTMMASRLPVLYPSNINRCRLLSGVGSAAGSCSILEPQWRDLSLQMPFQPLEGGRNTPLSYLDVTGTLVTCTTCTSVFIYLFICLLFFSLTFKPFLHTKRKAQHFHSCSSRVRPAGVNTLNLKTRLKGDY